MGKHSEQKETKGTKSKNGFYTFLKILGIIILIIILIALGVGIGGYIYLRNSLGQMQQVEIDEEAIEVNEGVKESLEGYRTIALFGVDSRSNQFEKGTRSDCIILAIINQKTKEVNLVSVYRDTYLQIAGRGFDKVTHAYAFGGAQLSMSTLNTNLDLNITEFATVNFYSIIDIVDAIGGVTMNIQNDEIKHINQYINDMHVELGRSSNLLTKAGNQNLNGMQALAYARVRYTAGGDYKRTERMRDVLMAVVEKAKKMGVGELNKLAKIALPKIYTNISPDEIMSIIPQLATYKFSESMGWPYETRGDTINGVWYGVPINLAENVKKLHREVLAQEDYTVSNKVKSISDSIISKTGYK